MNLTEDRLKFRSKKSGSNPYRLLLWASLILAGLWLLVQLDSGEVRSPLEPMPTPTRTTSSYAQEGQALFESGNLTGAISAYQDALAMDPDNAQLWAEQARIQTYSSALLTTDSERFQRLQEALESINEAVELAPDNSDVHAIRSFVLDWNANHVFARGEERDRLLSEATTDAVRALQLNPQNTLALAYYAEVLLDQQNWSQAQQFIEQAVSQDPTLLDVHRVRGLVRETLGQYRLAIESYNEAVKIAPNMTFLYLYIGYNYRHLKVYNRALENFDQAAKINQQIGVEDPLPYIAIAKTYVQQGEFFIAARNAERALELDPYNPNTYGQLGDIYVRSRNYEGALPVLKCAVYGCSGEENEATVRLLDEAIAVEGLPLTSIEVAYYYLRYGSVLAALNECEQARPVLDEVMQSFGGDPIIADIVAENREICRILQGSTDN